ncbi:MAG: hypothetical protein H6Q90_5343, partial [Deltaproteobacteria bacterium]|nr:hypothetical protein [Deltaproteobacteria bacterium]
ASAYYFPNAGWQAGWVVFDVALGAALFALGRRWRPRLANLVATAVTADAVVTLIQAIAYDLPRRRGIADVVVIVIAILAPTIAAAMLWNARGYRKR